MRQNQTMAEQNARMKYINFVLPKHPRVYSFDETVKNLKELFSVRIFQLTKNDADNFLTHAGTVNRSCEYIELRKITADQSKSLIFTCWFRSLKDADIRMRLLSKFEVNTLEECTLESLIMECQRLQNLKHGKAMVEHRKSVSTICVVKQKPSSG